MMILWSRLCLLVGASLCVSRGQNVSLSTEDFDNRTDSPHHTTLTASTRLQNEIHEDGPDDTTSGLLQNDTDPTSPAFLAKADNVTDTREDFKNSKAAEASTTISVPEDGKAGDDADVKTTKTNTSPEPPQDAQSNSAAGYVILVMIILVIIVLCGILYLLRRTARTYSFDLQSAVPVNNPREPIETFELVYLDDQDKSPTIDLQPPPAANGTTPRSEENGSHGENGSQGQPDVNGLVTSPTSNASPSLGEDSVDDTLSPLKSTNTEEDATEEEQQNENNNNPSSSSDPFVEINLNDPAWSEQLFTAPETSSSVLPFFPFSFPSTAS